MNNIIDEIKEIATTYKEYKKGVELVKGMGALGCYQGLDYLESLINNEIFYTEELEDSLVFIISHINSIEKQLRAHKDKEDKLIKYIEECESRDEDAHNEKLLEILDGSDE